MGEILKSGTPPAAYGSSQNESDSETVTKAGRKCRVVGWASLLLFVAILCYVFSTLSSPSHGQDSGLVGDHEYAVNSVENDEITGEMEYPEVVSFNTHKPTNQPHTARPTENPVEDAYAEE